jgi:hypothetical protein
MDMDTGTRTYVGDYDHDDMFDIALAVDGSMYGVADGGYAFVSIDPFTAHTTYIGDTDGLNGLAATARGIIYGSGFDRIYTIDTRTGQATLVGRTGGLDSAGDLAGGPPRPLYFASDGLARVNPATGSATAIGTSDIDCLYGLADTPAGLFGATCWGEVLRINRTSGVPTLIDDTGPSWLGMAARPWDGSTESKLSCRPGAADAITRIAYGTKVDCSFKPGSKATFKKWVAPHFVGASTKTGARFTARQGGAGSITAVYLDASGTRKTKTIDYAVTIKRPRLALPFQAVSTSVSWKYSGGPHCDWNTTTGVCAPGATAPAGRARYAIDLVPPKESKCAVSSKPARSVAAGTVKKGKGDGSITVQIDHGGGLGTGYYHLKGILVKKGDRVVKGQALGYPACAGTDSTHLHFYVCNQPITGYCKADAKAETSIAIKGTVLGGWRVKALAGNYDGTLTKDSVVLTASDTSAPKIPVQ